MPLGCVGPAVTGHLDPGGGVYHTPGSPGGPSFTTGSGGVCHWTLGVSTTHPLSPHTLFHHTPFPTPCEQNESQTGAKALPTLPSETLLAGGNNPYTFLARNIIKI